MGTQQRLPGNHKIRLWRPPFRLLILMAFVLFCLPSCDLLVKSTQPVDTPAPTQTSTPTLTPTDTPTAEPSLTPTITVISPSPSPTYDLNNNTPGYNPLTGLIVEDPQLLERRPVMVKVSNWPRLGRPHAGLSSADIVFEYYIGAYMNRFLAIYYGNDAQNIGPVRSGRLVDAQLAQLYQGVLAYGDADLSVDKVLVDILGERALPFHILPCPAMCGEATHSATGVFANSTELTRYVLDQGIDNTRPDLRAMVFRPEAQPGDEMGTLVSFVYADFSLTEWRYDPTSGTYLLWQDSEMDNGRITKAPTIDRNTGEPLSFENIVIIFTNYIEHTPSMHDIEVAFSSTYPSALFFRDGKMTYGTWHAPNADRPLVFQNNKGEFFPFKPGKTWIILAGNHTTTEQVKPGEWDFYFAIP